MIKVYLDWNVMTLIKNGKHKELEEILGNKERFLTPFSTTHIGDLFSSFDGSDNQQAYIDSDIEFISKFTEERCLFNQSDAIVIDHYPPEELFEQRKESAEMMKNLSKNGFWSLFEGLDIPEEILTPYKTLMQSIPAAGLINTTSNDEDIHERANKLFPDLKENATFDDMLNGVTKMINSLNETESYKDLRQTVQSGLNIQRDKIINSKDPYEIIDGVYEKTGLTRVDNLKNSKQGLKWYNEICDEYIQLDMHGYQEDKVNTGKGRKQTFKNTTEDAFHCAFATTCNFYITNDDKSYNKTKKVYEKLELQTIVLKPDEFVEYFKKYLDFKDDSVSFHLVDEIIKQMSYYEESRPDSKLRIYYMPYFLFDFFNKIMVIVAKDDQMESIILSRNNPTHNFILATEIKKLLARLNASLGKDNDNFGELGEKELDDEAWRERVWIKGNVKLTLRRINGHFQLYLNFLEPLRRKRNFFFRKFSALWASVLRIWKKIFPRKEK